MFIMKIEELSKAKKILTSWSIIDIIIARS